MGIGLRLEDKKDHRRVEEVTREAFWNVYAPGCEEHMIVRNLRKTGQFIPALDFVAFEGRKIVGHIIYVETKITGKDGVEHKVAAFGPVSVLPGYQGKGIGSRLILHTARLAGEMGYRAILIYGDPEYYKRFGFRASKEFGITNREGKYPAALLALELYHGALKGLEGVYDEGDIYSLNKAELEEFEKGFPPKEKKSATESQERFLEMVDKFL